VTIELSTQGVPAYDFALEGAADWQWSTDECEGLKSGYDLIQIGSLTAVMQPGSDALLSTLRTIKTHSPETVISFDPNARPAAAPDVATANAMRSRIVEFVDLADVIKVSDEDLEWIDSSLSPDATAANWSLRGPQLVIMTRGEKGSTAFVQGKAVVHVSTVEVSLVDTVGAGDTYMAWVVRGLIADHNARVTTNTADLEKLLSTAAQAAAITCSRKGCNPPLLSEVAL
jgi:fructokinase